ncbi:MAG TPA: hypothetical protein VF337_00315 [Candidatus Limnocylindrales bacterium]
MQEFWFCASCKSMNRGTTAKCYRCNAQREQTTLATVAERSAGVVLTPGLDEDHREIAWALMSTHRYVSAWLFGYISAALLILYPVLLTLALVDLVAMVISYDMLNVNAYPISFDLAQIQTLGLLWLVAILVSVLTTIVHSTFLALTSMNTGALGSGTPRFGAVRAWFWWHESSFWALWGLQVFLLPIYVFAGIVLLFDVLNMFGLLLGIAVAIFLIMILREALNALGGPIASMAKPKRLPQDLLERLGVPGDSDTRWAGLWGMAWTTARGVEFTVLLALPLLSIAVLLLFVVLLMTGAHLSVPPPDQFHLYGYLIFGLIVAIRGAAGIFGFFAMANITVQLARRQRVREKWVMSGADRARARMFGAPAAPVHAPGPLPGVAYQPPGVAPDAGFAQPVRIAPSPVGARPVSRTPILAELPPDDMTPDWSRPVFSTKAAAEPTPAWTPPPVPTETDPPAWPRPAQQFAPLASNELPSAWRRAVQHGVPPSSGQPAFGVPPTAGPAPLAPFNQPAWANPPAPLAPIGPGAESADQSVIQPSSNNLPRYRPPEPRMPQGPSGDPNDETEPGGGS